MIPANPLNVRQAPDYKALRKTAILVVPDQPLSTPPMSQEYFEPGVNTKLTKRKTPKTNYTLPSDLPEYPMGYVPTNQTPGAAGEEPSIIKVKENVPADLIQVFARIQAEEKAIAEMPKYGIDTGTMLMREYSAALKETQTEKKFENLIRQGFSDIEAKTAMATMRAEEALKVAKEIPKPAPVEVAISEALGRVVEVPEGKRAIIVPEEKLTPAEKLAKATLPQVLAGKQATLKGFVKKSGE